MLQSTSHLPPTKYPPFMHQLPTINHQMQNYTSPMTLSNKRKYQSTDFGDYYLEDEVETNDLISAVSDPHDNKRRRIGDDLIDDPYHLGILAPQSPLSGQHSPHSSPLSHQTHSSRSPSECSSPHSSPSHQHAHHQHQQHAHHQHAHAHQQHQQQQHQQQQQQQHAHPHGGHLLMTLPSISLPLLSPQQSQQQPQPQQSQQSKSQPGVCRLSTCNNRTSRTRFGHWCCLEHYRQSCHEYNIPMRQCARCSDIAPPGSAGGKQCMPCYRKTRRANMMGLSDDTNDLVPNAMGGVNDKKSKKSKKSIRPRCSICSNFVSSRTYSIYYCSQACVNRAPNLAKCPFAPCPNRVPKGGTGGRHCNAHRSAKYRREPMRMYQTILTLLLSLSLQPFSFKPKPQCSITIDHQRMIIIL
jgi:hypothetical protein